MALAVTKEVLFYGKYLLSENLKLNIDCKNKIETQMFLFLQLFAIVTVLNWLADI